MPRGKDYQGTINNHCELPYKQLIIDSNSDCFVCMCDAWLPIPVGKISEFNTLESIWNSPTARMLQQDIQDKKFTWCAVEHCGILYSDVRLQKHRIHVNIDNSCNLSCPSCRRDTIMIDSGDVYQSKLSDFDYFLNLLKDFDQPVKILLSGSGDPLASRISRNLFKTYQPRPNQEFVVKTNGLLIKKIIPNSTIRSQITLFDIGVDAGSQSVYEQVRRGGKWHILQENLKWLSENRQQSSVVLTFVLQKNNYRDIFAFAELCQDLEFQGSIQPLNDWGTWNYDHVDTPDDYTKIHGTYLDHDVMNPNHIEHQDCLNVLHLFVDRHYNNTKLAPFFKKFISQ